MQKAVGEFGVSLKRPAFISEKAPLKRSNLKKPSDQWVLFFQFKIHNEHKKELVEVETKLKLKVAKTTNPFLNGSSLFD